MPLNHLKLLLCRVRALSILLLLRRAAHSLLLQQALLKTVMLYPPLCLLMPLLLKVQLFPAWSAFMSQPAFALFLQCVTA